MTRYNAVRTRCNDADRPVDYYHEAKTWDSPCEYDAKNKEIYNYD
jgi:hypothetical protein